MVNPMATVFSKLIDMKISLVTIVGWAIAAVGLTWTGAQAYGEQQQKLVYLAERQTKIEVVLDRTEMLVRDLTVAVTRIEAEIKARPPKK